MERVRLLRFGPFELDRRAAELRKHDLKIRLQEQPFQILLMLLEQSGEVVLREELRKRLWPNDTIVEFDHGINAAIKRLRDALGESAENPRYVETVARRGYRFIGEIESTPGEQVAPAAEPEPEAGDLTGKTLSHYRVLEKLGGGGMGEVYRARDIRLGRDVALKVLPADFAQDASRRGRFEREARAVAALNHPNIVALFDIGSEDGVDYMVTEYVQGETLRAADLPPRKAIDIAAQVAEGLAAAHTAGVTHRDIKPDNVMVTTGGRAKILDFGLAKVTHKPGEDSAMTVTGAGTVIGTVGYMSPEQVRGEEVDHRSDIFSFGTLLYELLSGKRAFPGDSAVEAMNAILKEDPPELPESTPSGVRGIVAHCLEKEPEQRFQSARDLAFALRGVSGRRGAGSDALPVTQSTAPKRAFLWVGAALLLVGVLAAVIVLVLGGGEPRRGTALRLTPFSFEPGGQTFPVWSPDGKAVAFAARQNETDPYQVYVRYLDSPVATQITRVPEGAVPRAWTSAGRIVFRRQPGRLWSISPVGGEPEPFFTLDAPMHPPAFSSDGSVVAFLHQDEDGVSLWTSSPPGAPWKRYLPAPFASRAWFNIPWVQFSRDGKQILLMRHAGTGEEAWLMPYPADASRPPRRILRDLPALAGTPQFSWMPDNRHIVLSMVDAFSAPAQLYMADTVSGAFERISSGTTAQNFPAVSPDGSKLVFMEQTVNFDIVSVDLATTTVTPLIATQRSEQMPAWALGQPALVYVTDRNGVPEIWLHKPGQAERPLVTKRDFPPDTTQWFLNPALSPDANRVIYTRVERSGSARLWMSAVTGGAPVRLVKDDSASTAGSWSPDGAWFVYWDLQEARTRLNKVKTTGVAEPETLKAEVDTKRSTVPVWSPAGDWILHYDNAFKLLSPDGKTTREVASQGASAYAFSPDGGTLYGIRQAAGRVQLFSVGVAGAPERIIGSLGPEYSPVGSFILSLRLTLTPDGRSITYSTGKMKNSLWLMEGLTVPEPGLLERLGLR